MDYQDISTKDMPKEDRRKKGIGDIWSNAIKCLKCGDVVRSTNRHDMRWCKCESCSIDGGSWYNRVCATDLNAIEYLTEYYDDADEKT